MAEQQFARGLYSGFAPEENPFGVPNGMDENLRTIDDHLAIHVLTGPVAVGTAVPANPVNGIAQIYEDGSYDIYNGGAWKKYGGTSGVVAQDSDNGMQWRNLGDSWIAESAVQSFRQPILGSVSRSLVNKAEEQLSVYDTGGDGSGAALSTKAVHDALAGLGARDAVDLVGGTFKVAHLNNPLGRKIKGGAIVKSAPQGGLVQLNSYGDDGKVFIGKEYLFRLFLRLRQGGTLKAFIYGDSTVATLANGGGYGGPNFEPQVLFSRMLSSAKGVRNPINITNRGVGGTRVSHMDAIPDIDTEVGDTDLFLIKYGINDAQDGPEGFASNLRAKLDEIRSNPYGVVHALSIVLIGPNATYDPGHGRSSVWYEQVRNIYVQAARDYKCAFFDTYAYLRDIDWAANASLGLMMDNPWNDGQSVHPTEIMQSMIWGGLCDAMIGTEAVPYTGLARGSTSLGLLNAWEAYGGGFATPSASMSSDGWVTVKGLIKSGTVGPNLAVAQLPAGMEPREAEIFDVSTSTGRCSLRVNTLGAIEQQDSQASQAFTSLSGIRFNIRG